METGGPIASVRPCYFFITIRFRQFRPLLGKSLR
jgi:hypothetical protein